jgi:hypothetical protein
MTMWWVGFILFAWLGYLMGQPYDGAGFAFINAVLYVIVTGALAFIWGFVKALAESR